MSDKRQSSCDWSGCPSLPLLCPFFHATAESGSSVATPSPLGCTWPAPTAGPVLFQTPQTLPHNVPLFLLYAATFTLIQCFLTHVESVHACGDLGVASSQDPVLLCLFTSVLLSSWFSWRSSQGTRATFGQAIMSSVTSDGTV